MAFEGLTEKLSAAFKKLRGKGRLSEADVKEAMKEIRMALLEADVNFKVVKSFIKNTKERCLDAEVLDSLTPAQNVIKVVLDELTKLLGESDSQLVLSSRIPNVIMLVGLQGSGKTTAAAKLAYLLKKQNHNPLLVACDVYRPAAADQLQTLGDEIGVRVYRGDGKDPVKIAQEGVRDAVDSLRDVVIVDTAGRLHVDEEMMAEAAAIRDAVEPDQILMVVDAMTGQDVVNVASAFAEQVDFDGVNRKYCPGVLEYELDARHDHAYPNQTEHAPHHAKQEVRAPIDRAERAAIIPGDRMPEHFHDQARQVFHGGAEHHCYEEDDQIVSVVEPIEKHR